MQKLHDEFNRKIANSIVELIQNNQKDMIGVYMVPFSFGDCHKLQVTFVGNKEMNVSEILDGKTSGVQIYVNSNTWDMYQKEKELDDSFYTGNYLQVRDLKNAEIIYDPQGLLASKKEELRKKPGTVTYYNLSTFFQGVIKLSKEQLQGILKVEIVEKEEKSPIDTNDSSKSKQKRKSRRRKKQYM